MTDFLIGYNIHGKQINTTTENNNSITFATTSFVNVNKTFEFGKIHVSSLSSHV